MTSNKMRINDNNKVYLNQFFLNDWFYAAGKKIYTFFEENNQPFEISEAILFVFEGGSCPTSNVLFFSVPLYPTVAYGCYIATISRKFIFAGILMVKVG